MVDNYTIFMFLQLKQWHVQFVSIGLRGKVRIGTRHNHHIYLYPCQSIVYTIFKL